MSDDRYLHDPFAPAPSANALTGAVAPPPVEVDEQGDGENDWDEMSKAELVAAAEDAGVATYGTKADIIARLRGQD